MPSQPTNDAEAIEFELRDRSGRLAAVRLIEEIGLPDANEFTRARGGWQLRIARPDVARMEYLFEIEDHNGHRTTITDPGNPRRAGGAFGDKSVLEFDDYRRPDWLAVEPVPSDEATFEIDAPGLDGPVEATVWAPSDLAAGEPAPLLIVHDGPEYATLAGFTHYLGASIGIGALPPVRAALLGPGDRNDWYSANPAYATALDKHVVAALDEVAAATVRIGVGASLGALAMLHAHRTCPGTFDALMLQSGSFFTPELDPQERDFSSFQAVTEFVASITSAQDDPAPVPATLTCGTVEENRANNEAMTAALRRLGYRAELVLVRDAHNYTAWRDALDPNLTRLVAAVAGHRAA